MCCQFPDMPLHKLSNSSFKVRVVLGHESYSYGIVHCGWGFRYAAGSSPKSTDSSLIRPMETDSLGIRMGLHGGEHVLCVSLGWIGVGAGPMWRQIWPLEFEVTDLVILWHRRRLLTSRESLPCFWVFKFTQPYAILSFRCLKISVFLQWFGIKCLS